MGGWVGGGGGPGEGWWRSRRGVVGVQERGGGVQGVGE